MKFPKPKPENWKLSPCDLPLGLLTKEKLVKLKGVPWSEYVKKKAKQIGQVIIHLPGGTEIVGEATLYPPGVVDEVWPPGLEAERFDRLTAEGFCLNLITGKYVRRYPNH